MEHYCGGVFYHTLQIHCFTFLKIVVLQSLLNISIYQYLQFFLFALFNPSANRTGEFPKKFPNFQFLFVLH